MRNQKPDLMENPYPHGANRDILDSDCEQNLSDVEWFPLCNADR